MARRYGPYRTADGYVFHCTRNDDGSSRSTYEHREVMARALGRDLTDDEVVHHINQDPGDNRIENLEVMTASEHASHHASAPEVEIITCPWCKCEAVILSRYRRHNQNQQGKFGPFCGKSCAGKWSRSQQIKSGRINLRA